MKKYFAAFTATALISVAPFAMAASSTDLTVTGTITPSACDVSFPGGSDVHYGKILAKDLNQTTVTPMPYQRKQLNVTCDAATQVALHLIDNRSDTSSANGYFGMGLTPADEVIGNFIPWIHNVLADGANARSIASNGVDDENRTWFPAAYVSPNHLLTASATGQIIPLAVQNLSMDVEVRAWIARADSLTLTDDVAIDGSMTFELKYL